MCVKAFKLPTSCLNPEVHYFTNVIICCFLSLSKSLKDLEYFFLHSSFTKLRRTNAIFEKIYFPFPFPHFMTSVMVSQSGFLQEPCLPVYEVVW